MKVKGYVRVARNKSGHGKLSVGSRPSHHALESSGWEQKPLPTVAFAVEFDVPDELFDRGTEVVATIQVPAENATVLVGLDDKAAA